MKKRFLIIVGSGLFLTLIFLGSLYIFSFRLNGKSRVEINYGEVYKDLGCNVSIFSKTLNKYLKV